MEIYLKRHLPEAEFFFREGCWINELWNVSEDASVSVARVRVESGCRTRPHRLRETAERYVIQSGSGTVFLGDRPGETVSPGDVVHIPAGEVQSIEAAPGAELVFLAICTPRFRETCYVDCGDAVSSGDLK